MKTFKLIIVLQIILMYLPDRRLFYTSQLNAYFIRTPLIHGINGLGAHPSNQNLNRQCQEKTQGGSDDERKGGKRMKMSEETRCKVRYKGASTDLYRWGEPDRDVYVQKW